MVLGPRRRSRGLVVLGRRRSPDLVVLGPRRRSPDLVVLGRRRSRGLVVLGVRRSRDLVVLGVRRSRDRAHQPESKGLLVLGLVRQDVGDPVLDRLGQLLGDDLVMQMHPVLGLRHRGPRGTTRLRLGGDGLELERHVSNFPCRCWFPVELS